jgi:hypothetical protein
MAHSIEALRQQLELAIALRNGWPVDSRHYEMASNLIDSIERELEQALEEPDDSSE